MEGRIDSISPIKKSRNGKDYLVVTISGDMYSVWEPSIMEGLKEKDQVEFTSKKYGNFNKLISISKLDAQDTVLEISTDHPIEFKKGNQVESDDLRRIDERLCEISSKLSMLIDIMSSREKPSDR